MAWFRKEKLEAWFYKDKWALKSFGYMIGVVTVTVAVLYGLPKMIDRYMKTPHIAEKAIYISEERDTLQPDKRCSNQIFPANEDVNQDGTLETVLYLLNPKTNAYEKFLIEQEKDKFRIRSFEVVEGQIRYLDDCLK